MLEDSRLDKDGFALITRATPVPASTSDVSPNSWILCDDGFIPFEFSRIYLLRMPNLSPITHPLFFSELAIALQKTSLKRIIGPALNPSLLVDQQRPASADVMLELSAIDDRANVLRFAVFSEQLSGSPIETYWAAGNIEKPETSAPAEPEKVAPTRVCTRICPSVQNPPVHQGTFIHQQS